MNGDASKRQKLEELREKIKGRWPKAFLFPEHDGVQGFLGTSPVMLAAERPSTAKEFSGPAKSLLYPFLKEIGAGDGHLTDVIKTPARVGQPYPEDITDHRRFFDLEIEIVQPSLIVAFGQKAYDLLQFSLAGCGIKIREVWHYSYAGRWPGKREAWKTELRKVLEEVTPTAGDPTFLRTLGADVRRPD